ncbi:TPA: hypothetical protein OMS38_002444 [Klebsiella aerogenes]|nr:hypothetical protein [Klebsiella aerogenes]HCR0958193.1 hypothetical protein [Klebsiella aerogenes]
MVRIFLFIIPLILTGCINVYGPVKAGGQTDSSAEGGEPGIVETGAIVKIGNRKPDELMNVVQIYYQQKGLTPVINNPETGIIAATGHDDELANLFLDCSLLPQTQNIQESYRVITQVWSAGEGSNVSVSVTGIAGLTAADGNDKVKPVECKSTGTFEKDILERLRK